MKKIKLGQSCRDTITGFTGIAIAKVKYITGCDKVELQPKQKEDGTVPESTWVDVNRVEVLDEPVVKLGTSKDKGAGNLPHGRGL
jgi:hypothetical protein